MNWRPTSYLPERLRSAEAREAADYWLSVFGLDARVDAKVEELSHGNQQRVQLIVALVHAPPVLILDEPFSGLDPIAAHTMAGVLRDCAERGVAVLFSSHQLDVVEGLCEDVVIINQGQVILSGKVNRLRARSPLRYLDVVFNGPFDAGWIAAPEAAVVETRTDGARLRISDDADIGKLAHMAASAGTVAKFSVEPPPLSELFREVVSA